MGMAQLTEAACLIDQGAMFPDRTGFRGPDGRTVLIGFKPGACSIYFDDEPIYHFDLEGRWQRAFLGADSNDPTTPANLAGVPGTHYLKAMDTATTSLQRLREGHEIKIHRKRLNFAETVGLDDHIRQMSMDLHHQIATQQLEPISPPSSGRTAGRSANLPEILDFLERIAGWDTAAWSRQKERYESTFGILPMTPPNLTAPMVLQPILGDDGQNPVGFAGSATSEFYLRDQTEFHRHLQNVKNLWHRRLPQARGIYLAGSDLIHQPMSYVLDILNEVQQNVAELTIDLPGRLIDPAPTPQRSDIQMLTYHFRPNAISVEMLREYAQRGLSHMTVAIESASQEVRSLYGRSGTDAELADFLTILNEAKIKTSIVLTVGAGGTSRPDDIETTISFIRNLPIASGTIIYLMDAAETASPAWKNQHSISDSNSQILYTLCDKLNQELKERKIRATHYTLEKDWQ
jgi:hypothetical protein